MNEIADFPQFIEFIYEEVEKLGLECGMQVSREEILRALTELVEAGLAKAYRLYTTGQPADELDGVPPPDPHDRLRNPYFGLTEKGKQLQLMDDPLWPFDSENQVRAGWVPPCE